MAEYNEEVVAAFDVDDTLVTFKGTELYFNEEHIDLLKQFYLRGFHIIVWSRGGKKWAENVVNLLGLRNYVHQVMSKPMWYIDDKDADQWMDRVFKGEVFNGKIKEVLRTSEDDNTLPGATHYWVGELHPILTEKGEISYLNSIIV